MRFEFTETEARYLGGILELFVGYMQQTGEDSVKLWVPEVKNLAEKGMKYAEGTSGYRAFRKAVLAAEEALK